MQSIHFGSRQLHMPSVHNALLMQQKNEFDFLIGFYSQAQLFL
jgi:hypothetical protein